MNFADNNILLILISLVLIYAVLSIFVSIIVERWNFITQERGRHLKACIEKLLKDPHNQEYGRIFYDHFTISGLSINSKPPHYISATMFADAFIDIIAAQVERHPNGKNSKGEQVPRIHERFSRAVESMNDSQFSELLRSFADKSDGDYQQLKAMIERWYDDYMDRVTGWYKGKQRFKLLVAGFGVAIALNVDSLYLIKVLSMDDNLKNRLTSTAEGIVENYSGLDSVHRTSALSLNRMVISSLDERSGEKGVFSAGESHAHLSRLMRLNDSLEHRSFLGKDSVSKQTIHQLDSAMGILSSLNVPIGWSWREAPLSWFSGDVEPHHHHLSKTPAIIAYIDHRNAGAGDWNWFRYLAGIAITGFSLSFGAPFWFELLVKAVNIRISGKRPLTQKEK